MISTLRDETRTTLLKVAQAQIDALLKQQIDGKLCKDDLKTGVCEVIKYMDAMPIHEDGSGGGG